MLLLFLRQLLEHAPPPCVARDTRRPRIEVQAAALRRDRDPQRIAREQQLWRPFVADLRPPGLAGLAGPVDLQDALPRREAARRRDLLDQRLDVGAEELERAVALLANQMKMPRMAV